ncbi:hypothetical protein C8Q80DRAFT_1265551 [Daedaleopsis nitida]|nr:hypothetical protein C8Q80DRAFT_1265551 [Daedaleopsis nitida]
MAVNLSPTITGRRAVDAVPALFDQALLKDEVAVEAAMRALERHLADPAADPEDTVVELGETTHALEFALLGVSADAYTILSKTILEQFPTALSPQAFLSSHTCQLLLHFPLFFRYVDDRGKTLKEHNVTSWWRTTQGDIDVLKALTKLSYSDGEPPLDNAFDDEYEDVQFIVKYKAQGKKKQAPKRGHRNSPAHLKTIIDRGFDVPHSSEEQTALVSKIFETQRESLQRYLKLFRLFPAVPTILRACGIGLTDAPDSTSATVVAPKGTTIVRKADTYVVGDVPSLPPVLPMKAALYFDSAVGFGEWRILISTRADRDLRQARRRDANTFKIYVKKIKQLSNGHFSDDNQKRLTGLNVEIPIFEAKMTDDTRLVYTVDCVPEFQSNIERQVIRIFGIYTHAQLDRKRFWDCMSRQLERRGPEYRKRCTFRNVPVSPRDKVYSPASWPPLAELAPLEPVSSVSDMRKDDLEELHSLLVLEKFVTFSQALLNSIIADQEVAHVFDVSAQEKQIIEHPSSCFVLGRSGTGKTTTMLFKMLGIERAWEDYHDTMPKPRQLFVTQSRVLAEKVEEYFAKLLDSLATASQSPKELVKMAARRKQQQEQGLVDRDEEIYWRGDLPKRYGALQKENFPMFLTYDHICRLLEAEFKHCMSEVLQQEADAHAMQAALELQDPTGNDPTDGALSNDYMQQRRAKFNLLKTLS